MLNLHFKNRIRYYLQFVSLSLMLIIFGCQSEETDKTSTLNKDITDQLPAGADIETIAEHLIQVRQTGGTTRALAIHYPNLNKEKAYKIQMIMLTKLEEQGEKLVGWKMGGARVTDPNLPFEPAFGFMLASDEFQSSGVANNTKFAPGSPLMEAEVGFILKKDLTKSTTSRNEVIDAIESVGGFCELISVRTRDAKGGIKATSAQFIADGMSHGGFIQPSQKYILDAIELTKVEAKVLINGEIKVEGNAENFAFLDALLFLNNSLSKYGRHLHSGDIIITGSILTPPQANAGDNVEIKFSNFESLNLEFELNRKK